MARPLRLEFPHASYHLTSRGNARHRIVRDDTDRQTWLATVAQVIARCGWLCHASCLMDHHYHLLVETPRANLSRGMRQLNGVDTQAVNRRHHRVGHLFQGRFKALVVEKEAYLLELCRYVVLNPVRAGVVTTPRAYPWSSYRATAGLSGAPAWLTVDWVLEQFDHPRRVAQTQYRAFVAEGIRQPSRPWEQVVGQVYLGGAAFIRRVQRHGRARGEDAEIPRAQREPYWLAPTAVLERVAQTYAVRVVDLLRPTRRPSEARQVALYGLRRLAGEALPAISRRMGVTYSAVSRRVSAVEQRRAADPRWRARLAELADVKVKT